jgi:hypothetical protein
MLMVCAAGLAGGALAQQKSEQQKDSGKAGDTPVRAVVSFSRDVMPILKNNCMPCHAEEQFNPSELSLDSYELLIAGGKHGESVEPGDASKSILVQKLHADPPFGDRMPFDPRKKRKRQPMTPLKDEEISIISEWVNQGAKDN